MAGDNIEVSGAKEASDDITGNSRKLPIDRRDLGLQDGEENPLRNVDFWRSIWSAVRKGALILLGMHGDFDALC